MAALGDVVGGGADGDVFALGERRAMVEYRVIKGKGWAVVALRTMICPHCYGEGFCFVCNGKGWVASEWGQLWRALRQQESLVYTMDYCDACGDIRPVVRLRQRRLCADCAAAVGSEAARWEMLTRPLFGTTAQLTGVQR